MNEERRDKLAREYPDQHHPELSDDETATWPDWAVCVGEGFRRKLREATFAAYRAGWNAGVAEMLTTRKESEPRE